MFLHISLQNFLHTQRVQEVNQFQLERISDIPTYTPPMSYMNNLTENPGATLWSLAKGICLILVVLFFLGSCSLGSCSYMLSRPAQVVYVTPVPNVSTTVVGPSMAQIEAANRESEKRHEEALKASEARTAALIAAHKPTPIPDVPMVVVSTASVPTVVAQPARTLVGNPVVVGAPASATPRDPKLSGHQNNDGTWQFRSNEFGFFPDAAANTTIPFAIPSKGKLVWCMSFSDSQGAVTDVDILPGQYIAGRESDGRPWFLVSAGSAPKRIFGAGWVAADGRRKPVCTGISIPGHPRDGQRHEGILAMVASTGK